MTEEQLEEFLRRGQRASEETARLAGRQLGKTKSLRRAMDDFSKAAGEALKAGLDKQLGRRESKLEIRFAQQLDERGIPYVRNWLNAVPGRQFEVDYVLGRITDKLGVEVDGGAHQAAGRARRDYEKHLLLLLHGWTVLRLDGKLVKSGRGIELVLEIMRARRLL